jgi:hypothetical protein
MLHLTDSMISEIKKSFECLDPRYHAENISLDSLHSFALVGSRAVSGRNCKY